MMSFYDRLQQIERLRMMEVSGQDLPVTGISTSDYSLGLTKEGCTIEDEIRDMEEEIHLLKTEIEYLKS